MSLNYNEPLINAKYHFATAKRMFKSYKDFEEKRFLVGVINENAKAVSQLILAFLIREGYKGKDSRKNLKVFMEKIAPKYIGKNTRANLFKILEIEMAQKVSPIEFVRGDKIILLIEGKYRFLTRERLGEFLDSVEIGLKSFGQGMRQV